MISSKIGKNNGVGPVEKSSERTMVTRNDSEHYNRRGKMLLWL
ncbi:hypothetical protein SAMN05660648_02903 [Selenomonas ruminantium]|uniref:Uncharacterized protein n=1 Tax=Selenomonas ruminantium TaxID=971 RepID=A0A1H4AJ03_SELRU|nr:hypothetical protein SAMN05660648_02903 [Selenomonas ruminantium]